MKKQTNFYKKMAHSKTSKLSLLTAFLFFALSFSSLSAAVIYVDIDATAGNNNGTSWADAFTDLQLALAAGAVGDEIWVADGIYKPTNDTNRTIPFAMRNGLSVYGGFDGTEATLSQRNWSTNLCVLSGDIGAVGDISDNSYSVVRSRNLTVMATLDGFTITNGNANGAFGPGGLGEGGGMFIRNSMQQVSNCTFTGNRTRNDGSGKAIYSINSNLTMSNCLTFQNSNNSSVIYVDINNQTEFINCTLTGQVRFYSGSPLFTNTIARSINLIGGSTPVFVNSIIPSGYTCPSCPGNNGNVNPLLTSSFSLQACSPAIDAGDNSVSTSKDLAAQNRIANGTIDIGTYEFQSQSDLVSANCKPFTAYLNTNGNVTITAADVDNNSTTTCGLQSLVIDNDSFDCNDIGTPQNVQLTITDVNGESDMCTAIVTINDNKAPQITCPSNVSVNTDTGVCGAVVNFTVPVGTDNCANPNTALTSTLGNGDLFPIGATAVSYEVTDASNLTANCSFMVTVTDNEAPIFNETPPVSMTVECSNVPEAAVLTVSDNCDGTSLQVMFGEIRTDGNCANEYTLIRKWSAMDLEGNLVSYQQIVTVEDTMAPVLACPANVTVECGDDDSPVTTGYASASDNCGVTVLPTWTDVFETDNSNNPNTGDIVRTWMVTDDCGTAATPCKQTITVVDTTKPVINCSGLNFTAELENGECEVEVELPLPEVNDDCGLATLEWRSRLVDENNNPILPWSLWSSDAYPYGSFAEGRYRIQWRATDLSQNRKKCKYFLTVEDPDGLPCPWANNHVDCDAGSTYDYDAETFTLNSTDCHNSITSSNDEYAFVQQALCGNAEIIVKVEDVNGNSNGWAGVSMRETGAVDAKMVALLTNRSSNHRKEVRTTIGGNVTAQNSTAFNRHWLKLVRVGNSFRGYASSNGSSWFLKFSQTVAMNECIEVGMVLNAYVSSGDVEATFSNVSITGQGPAALQFFDNNNAEQAIVNDRFRAYPNPTSGMINFDFSGYFEEKGVLEVLNVNGQVIQLIQTGAIEELNTQINLTDQPAGVYTLRLRLDNGHQEVQRIILKRE